MGPPTYWELDAVGNWLSLWDGLDADPQNSTLIESREHSPLHTITERANGQIDPVAHDDRGRLLDDGRELTFLWDGRDRLVAVGDAQYNLLEQYDYDALGRRVARDRTVTGLDDLQHGVTLFAYAGQRCIEERTYNNGAPEPPDPEDPGLPPNVLPDVRAIYTFGA